MKKLVQNTGVRKWYGDEWISIQDEASAVIEGFFGHYNTPFILSGCVVNGATIAAGIVGLIHADGFKLCRFAGISNATFPVYLKPVKTEETRQYLDGAVKPVSYTYSAETSAEGGSGYLEIKADGSTPRFNDVVQNANYRFVSDSEKTSYAGQANSAISTLRGGVHANYDTLEKLRAYLVSIIPAEANIEDVYEYINGLSYLPVFSGTSELTGSTIDWEGTPERYKTLAADVTLDASNLVVGKTIGLKVSGAYTVGFSSKFVKAVGSLDPEPAETNYIQMKCINATTGSEMIVYTVLYLDV